VAAVVMAVAFWAVLLGLGEVVEGGADGEKARAVGEGDEEAAGMMVVAVAQLVAQSVQEGEVVG